MTRVVIIGGGFGGLHVARKLRGAAVDIVLIDRQNHHCFQPLLYQVASAGLSPGLIAPPLRWILRRQPNVRVELADVTDIDLADRVVVATAVSGETLAEPYDALVVAAGSRHGYFGHDEWEAFAPGLKTIDDALDIRRRVLGAFERAEVTSDAERRQRDATFVVVGAGPTGVELAGQVAEMARRTFRNEYRAFDPLTTRVILLDAGPRALAGFDPKLSAATARQLAEIGVELRTGAAVESVDENGVTVAGERIEAGTVIWAAGVAASPLGRLLAERAATTGGSVPEVDRAGRVQVDNTLRLPGHDDVFVIGDMAATGLPGVSPVAIQQGNHVGTFLRQVAKGKDVEPAPFRYRDKGNMATIGRSRAVAELGRLRMTGFVAWLLWLFVHVAFLIGFSNRLLVMLRWWFAYVSNGRGERALTGNIMWKSRPGDLPPA